MPLHSAANGLIVRVDLVSGRGALKRERSVEIWHAIVLGIVEGITEYLPISSTGHLILTRDILGIGNDPATRGAVDDFMIVVQGGAILAVLGLYRLNVKRMLLGLIGKDKGGLQLATGVFIAFLPAAVAGFLLKDAVKEFLFTTWAVLFALVAGGIYMIIVHYWGRGRFGLRRMNVCDDVTQVTLGQAGTIGLLQCFALWPGTSRSMMTITGGLFTGFTPRAAAEFSFLVGLPTLGASCLYSLLKNLKQARETNTENMFQQLGVLPCVVGMLVATIAAVIAVRWLVAFLTKHGLAAFGWYRIGLAIVMAVLLARGVVNVDGQGSSGQGVKANEATAAPAVIGR